MVICIIALPVLAILGIFSLRYRILAKEAFHCLFRTVVLKPCNTGLDNRIKSKFTAKLMWWPWLARGFYRYFTILSWIFVILTLLSIAGTGYGLYNYLVYGNCNGPDSSAFCVFNVVHSNQPDCSVLGVKGNVDVSKVNLTGAVIRGNVYAPYSIIEYGCYSCHYTKEAEPILRQILGNYTKVNLLYLDVPLDIHPWSIEAGKAAICAGEQNQYWQYHDTLFDNQDGLGADSFVKFARGLGLNMTRFNTCFNSSETAQQVEEAKINALNVGIYGTPTFIIGDRVLVGPQKYADLKSAVEREMKA